MRVEQTTREKRIHRENMMLYVFTPSRDAAAAWMMIGAGVGLAIVAQRASDISLVVSSAMFVIALMSLFSGVGWFMMIRSRLDAYYFDIMQERATEETITTDREEPKYAQREIPDGNGNIITTLPTVGKLSPREWRDVAFAIRVHGLSISQKVLAKDKDTKIMSQPQYKWWYSYMITNHLMTDGQPNELTQAGMDKLDEYLSPHQSG